MERPLEYLRRRSDGNFLLGYDNNEAIDPIEDLSTQLSQNYTSRRIIIAETDPCQFFVYFIAAVSANCSVFLCNPNWGQTEWQQVFKIVEPDLILGNLEEYFHFKRSKVRGKKSEVFFSLPVSSILIPTGGSSGKIRFTIHTWETLTASVAGFYEYFDRKVINSFCILPLYHVSGLMQLMRSLVSGGKIAIFSYKDLKNGKLPEIDPEDFFISLVPTQLQFLLESNPIWLSRFQTVLLGGAATARSLLDTARKSNINLAPTYGMTETASGVVILKPKDFLDGNNSSGKVLSHAEVNINSDRIINIKSKSMCFGYYPDLSLDKEYFSTDDLGYFDRDGYLYIIGRNSQKIITGGENVFPAEVEAAILATGLVKDICVIGLPDDKWGEVVTALYVAKEKNISAEEIKQNLKISKYKMPKYWFKIEQIPRCDRGKINFSKIKQIAIELSRNSF
ncbi:MAG: 2-succinylbenzoate--CoA ligase [Prochloraceae cyanobacterium]